MHYLCLKPNYSPMTFTFYFTHWISGYSLKKVMTFMTKKQFIELLKTQNEMNDGESGEIIYASKYDGSNLDI